MPFVVKFGSDRLSGSGSDMQVSKSGRLRLGCLDGVYASVGPWLHFRGRKVQVNAEARCLIRGIRGGERCFRANRAGALKRGSFLSVSALC